MKFSYRATAASLALLVALGAAGCTTQGAGPVAVAQKGDPAALGFNVARLELERDAMLADIKAGVVPGAVMIVGRHGKIAWMQALGQQGPNDPTPMSAATIFRIQSMTKPIVSVAVMTLVEEGKIGLDDPVSKYLPEFANSKVMDGDGTIRPAKGPITIRHLLTHTSGLIAVVGPPRTPLHKIWADSGTWNPNQTVLEASRATGALPMLADPGTLWNYGRSPDVLGGILEVVTGKTFDVVLKERIFKPLGMKDTDFYLTPAQAAGRVAKASTGPGSDPTQRRPMMYGSNGLVSTADDYLRFTLMIRNGGRLNGVRILKPQTLALMTTDQLGPGVSRKTFNYPGGGFGLGLGLIPVDVGGPHASIVYTWAGSDGTDFWIDPKNDVFAVYMIQNAREGGKLRARFSKAVYEALVK